MNATSATAAAAREPATGSLASPRCDDSISPYVKPPSASVASSVPSGSNPGLPAAAGRSGMRKAQIRSTTAAKGALRKKTARQDTCCAIQPPSTGPAADVSAENADQVPIALPRCASSQVEVISARLPG